MKSIYDISINSAEGESNFLQQYKGKVTMVVNTTVGCGNANQLPILQKLQEKYGPDKFEIIGVPTNDYCGPGVTHGKWSQGITCGLDSKNYSEDVYKTTFKYTEMVASNPNDLVSEIPGKNGLGHEHKEAHELYKEIQQQILKVQNTNIENGIKTSKDYWSWALNLGFDNGYKMGGNYEKYLIDVDGYVAKHYQCSVLNHDHEQTIKDVYAAEGRPEPTPAVGRSRKIFEEEFEVVCSHIEKMLAGEKSIINPNR